MPGLPQHFSSLSTTGDCGVSPHQEAGGCAIVERGEGQGDAWARKRWGRGHRGVVVFMATFGRSPVRHVGGRSRQRWPREARALASDCAWEHSAHALDCE
eukprot:15288655-Alexandrium_andersonii.AAC.1